MALVSTLPACIIHEIFKGCVHHRSDLVTQSKDVCHGMSFMEGHQFILVSDNHGNELDFANKLLLGDLGLTSYSKYITSNGEP